MERLYFLVPDLATTRHIVAALNTAGIDDKHLGVVAPASTPLGDLPEASVWETTELGRGIEGGLVVGGAAGLIGGLLAVTLPPVGLALAGSAVLATAAAGAGFGAVVSGLIAKDMPKKDIEALEGAIIMGHTLMLVDVPRRRKDEVVGVLKQLYPNTIIYTASEASPLLEGPLSIVRR